MPFGLKNAGATYRRMVEKVFEKWIHKTLEVYVDDMSIKIKEAKDHVDDLREIFEQMRKFNIKVNPEKCVFGVSSGKFLGYIVSKKGIEVDPEKVQAVRDMPPPATVKDVQTLNGLITSLGRWEILVDGSSSGEGNGIGIVFISPTGARMAYSFILEFASTNNETEYEAVVHALNLAIEMKIEDARITSDSQLVILQVEGTYSTNEPSLQKYKQFVMDLAARIPKISWRHIGRKDNRLADALAFIPSMLIDPVARDIKIEALFLPSIEKRETTQTDVMTIENIEEETVREDKDWRTEIHLYLEKGEVPRKGLEAPKLRSRATNYELREGILYRRSFLGPSLRCLTRKE
ncbi:uncharacterized protein LOC113328356 [Papaver somniferum]|uniref:uncharacterized protein LOC113328356 n=1 Tax=Papaver somniferum TaxID=3469 RepID=UPI000E6F58F2|nr:uncharacterized protein LOC113328356 [Papaver somniferum]